LEGSDDDEGGEVEDGASGSSKVGDKAENSETDIEEDEGVEVGGDTEGDEVKPDHVQSKTTSRRPITSVRTCKINSGLFNVEWERTVEVLEDIDIPDGHPMKDIEVWEREE
jgi:hypothetical protein